MDMLRMLEPLVRPDGRGPVSAASRQRTDGQAPAQPVEQASFEQLLDRLRATGEAEGAEDSDPGPAAPADEPARGESEPMSTEAFTSSPFLDGLGRVDRIDNPTLLAMLNRGGDSRQT